MRTIDADKLPEHKFTRESAKGSDYMRGWNDAIDTITDNAPTIEQPCMAVIPPEVIKTLSECVVDAISSIDWKTAIEKFSERKTGHWFLLDECANEGVYCSNCRKKVYRVEYANQKVKSNFCPNCGADMRGDRGSR